MVVESVMKKIMHAARVFSTASRERNDVLKSVSEYKDMKTKVLLLKRRIAGRVQM